MQRISEIDEDEIPEKQKKAKKEIEQVDDYYIKAAQEGSEYAPVSYFYSQGSKCEWCGNYPCSHMYVIEHKESGERLAVGSTCIEKVTGLGGSYNRHETFKEKIDKLARLKNKSKDEIKKQDVVTVAELNEEIEEEISEREQEKQKKIEEQREIIEDEGLDVLRHYNDFCRDVLDQSERKVLSDKQMSSLRQNKEYLLEDYESVEEFTEKRELHFDHELILQTLRDQNIISGFWGGNHKHSGHVEPARDFADQVLDDGRFLTDNQADYLYSILERYRKKVIPAILEENRNDRLRKLDSQIKDEVLHWEDGYVLAYNKLERTRYGSIRVEKKGWKVNFYRDEKSEVEKELEKRKDPSVPLKTDYMILSPKEFVIEDLDGREIDLSAGSLRKMLGEKLARFDLSDSERTHRERLETVNRQLEEADEDTFTFEEYKDLVGTDRDDIRDKLEEEYLNGGDK